MPVYQRRDDVEVIACADIDFGKAQKFAEDYGIPAVYASVEELLANCKPDYVDVCTWPAAHAPVAIAAANAGCIRLGITKINICTDIHKAFLAGIAEAQATLTPSLAGNFYRPAAARMTEKTEEMIRLFSTEVNK